MSYSEDLKGDAKVLKYGVYAKAVELLCFKPVLEKLQTIYPEMDLKAYKKRVKHEYREMLLRIPDIGGSSLEMNLYIAAFVFSLHRAEPQRISPNVVNEMVTAVFESPFMIKAHQNKKCTLFTDKVQDKKVKEGSYIERKHLHGGMCAAIFMLQEFVDCIACMGEECRECMI